MARKINLNSPDIYQKLGTPSITPRSATAYYFSQQERRRSLSQESTPHVQSPDFSKQLPRTELRQFSTDVHEKRFVAFQAFPTVSTRVPRIPVLDIARTTGRNFMSIYNKKQDHHDYSPNYKAIWKGSGKKLLTFDMSLPRRPFYKSPQYKPTMKDVIYSQIDANVAIPNLDKTSSRPGGEAVPTFMINVHYLDRVSGHVVPNFKSLKMNNYMNTTFLPLTSSFGGPEPKISNSVLRGRRGESTNSRYNN